MTVLSYKKVKTRKQHACWGCRKVIPVGTKTLTVTTVDWDTISTTRWCDICSQILDKYGSDMDPWDEGFPYGAIADEFPEYLAEFPKSTDDIEHDGKREEDQMLAFEEEYGDQSRLPGD